MNKKNRHKLTSIGIIISLTILLVTILAYFSDVQQKDLIWKPNTKYYPGEVVIWNGSTYVCNLGTSGNSNSFEGGIFWSRIPDR